MYKFIIVFICMSGLFSCTEEAPFDKIQINLGEQFTIELEANWTTGYAWEWENSQEVSVVDTISRVYIPGDPGLGGAPGIEKWTFEGEYAGQESIELMYCKTNEENAVPEEIRDYLVYVK